jgi:hypothetical protein
LVCHYFIEDFYIDVHYGDLLVVLFGCVLVWFWVECNAGFIEWVLQCSFPFYFLEKFEEYWYSSLKLWKNSAGNLSVPGLFFFGSFFCFNFIMCYRSV